MNISNILTFSAPKFFGKIRSKKYCSYVEKRGMKSKNLGTEDKAPKLAPRKVKNKTIPTTTKEEEHFPP